MSGHSKWSSIKHKKGAADKKRGQLFSKLSRALIVAAREGGPDPAANLALANAIEKARSYSMPKDNIDRAIARGSGADADADSFEQVVYEGYGPNGVAVIVEALTDNRNRTAADVRAAFTKHDGNLGGSGAVAWLFERRGVVLVDADRFDEDELTLAAAEGGAEDVERDGSSFRVTAAPEDLTAVREAIEAAGMEVDSSELTMVPKTTVNLDDEGAAKKTLRLIDALEENDDVQEVYANFDIPEQVMEAVAELAHGERGRGERAAVARLRRSSERVEAELAAHDAAARATSPARGGRDSSSVAASRSSAEAVAPGTRAAHLGAVAPAAARASSTRRPARLP